MDEEFLEEKIYELTQQRNELLEALKKILAEYDKTCDTGEMPYWPFEDAKAAISRALGDSKE